MSSRDAFIPRYRVAGFRAIPNIAMAGISGKHTEIPIFGLWGEMP
jgi:hypothetical protein